MFGSRIGGIGRPAGRRKSAPAAVAYRYWRILVSNNDGNADYVSMSRFVLYEGAVVKSVAQAGTGTTNSSIGAMEAANYCLNGSLADEWVGLKAALPVWVAVDLGAAVAITKYQVSSQRGVTGRTPSAWKLQGSNGSQTGPWADVNSATGQTGWGIQETREFNI